MAQKVLLTCGILAALLSLGTDLLAGKLIKGYSFSVQSMSELGAAGSPTRPVVIALTLLTSVLMIAFGVGVWRGGGGGPQAPARAGGARRRGRVRPGGHPRPARLRLLPDRRLPAGPERLPLRKIITEEMQLRFSSMQVDVFALLIETRQRIASMRAAIDAKRNFWRAQSDLQTAVNGGGSGETQTDSRPTTAALAGSGDGH